MSSDDARLLASSSPAGFAHVCSGGRWTPYEHLILLNEYLMRVVGGEIDRLCVTMPPRHGKSELVSRWLAAWYLGTFPDRQVMLASYEATFARSWGRKAREALSEYGPWVWDVHVAEQPRAADWWQVEKHDGVMVTAGVGGALTGKGADLLLLDDPIKNAEEAASQVMRAKAWDWWQSTASTRLQPGAAVILILTRWHEDDLAGRLLRDAPERWVTLNLPAFAEDADQLGREPGEALCPELFDGDALAVIRRQVGGYFWTAMYQQRPAPPEGFLFKRADLRYWREHYEPLGHGVASGPRWYVLADGDGTRRFDAGQCPRFQTVDAAISEKESADYTVVATWAVTPDLDLLLLDCQRRHFEEQQTVEFLAGVNDQHGRPPMWIERFGAGRNPLAILARRGHPVSEIPVEAGAQLDKVTRAFGAIALCERHKMFLPSGQPEWLGAYEDELCVTLDTVILTSQGIVRADEVKVGDKVLTHRGRFRPVTAIARRRAPELVEIRAKALDPLRLTPDHPVLAMQLSNGSERGGRYAQGVDWQLADSLRPRTFRLTARGETEAMPNASHGLVIPTLDEDYELAEIDLRHWYKQPALARQGTRSFAVVDDGETIRIDSGKSRPMRYSQRLDYRFGRLCGLWIAEGSYSRKNAQWSFNAAETDLIDEAIGTMEERFGIRPTTFTAARSPNCTVVSASLPRLEAWFKSFGHRAHGKRVPEWAWAAPIEFHRGLIDGWLAGDGCQGKGTTTSPHLAWGLRLLATRLGFWPKITRSLPKRSGTVTQGDKVYEVIGRHPTYQVDFASKTRAVEVWAEDDGDRLLGFWVRSVEAIDGDDVVNFQVEEDESYVTTGGTVHNCSFPNAAHDDQVDVTSYAARLLPRIGVAQRVEQASPAQAPLMAGLRGQRF